VLSQLGRIAADNGTNESIEGTEGFRSASAVGGDPDTSLEFPKRSIGVGSEDSIGPPGVEAEFGETSLELSDVVAAHHVAGHVGQHAVTQLPAGFIQSTESVGSDDAVDGDAALLLEGADRSIEVVIEDNVINVETCGQVVAES